MAEQWGTMGLCFSWITGADGLDSVQKGLRGDVGRTETGRRGSVLYVAIKISIFRRDFLPFRRENRPFSSRSLTGGSGCEEGDGCSRWS